MKLIELTNSYQGACARLIINIDHIVSFHRNVSDSATIVVLSSDDHDCHFNVAESLDEVIVQINLAKRTDELAPSSKESGQ